MSEIRSGGAEVHRSVIKGEVLPQLIAQRVGEATVYFRVTSETLNVVNEPELRAVAAPIDSNIFDEAGRVVSEGVRIIGEKVRGLTETLQPSELEVEISFGFEVKGKATIVPVILTGETASNVGLKVTATWKQAGKNSA